MNRNKFSGTVILADGIFPSHDIPLGYLKDASRIVCCDGAARSLIDSGLEPFAIVGDCDSLTPDISVRYSEKIFRYTEQDTNDLTKAVLWSTERGYNDITILGATGKREDHTVGNISLLAGYAEKSDVKIVTDHGIFYPVLKSSSFDTYPGQQVSVFSLDPGTDITSKGLKYPLQNMKLTSWWQATLNEATGNHIELNFNGGPLLVFIAFT